MEPGLHYGIYDALLDTNLKATLDRYPELRSVLGKIEAEEQPARYADFVGEFCRTQERFWRGSGNEFWSHNLD